jgi:hypothetical protein
MEKVKWKMVQKRYTKAIRLKKSAEIRVIRVPLSSAKMRHPRSF